MTSRDLASRDPASAGSSLEMRRADTPPAGWLRLTEAQQLELSRAAIDSAIAAIADRAEVLAEEMDNGAITDFGGAEALRLFAAILRSSNGARPNLATLPAAGTA